MGKNSTGQGIVLDDRGQEQPKDKEAALQTGKPEKRQQQSAMEGPAAYAPHTEEEKKAMMPAPKGEEKGAGGTQASKLEPEKQGGIGAVVQPKNQVTRERNVGEQQFGASPKPKLHENRKCGLRGSDNPALK